MQNPTRARGYRAMRQMYIDEHRKEQRHRMTTRFIMTAVGRLRLQREAEALLDWAPGEVYFKLLQRAPVARSLPSSAARREGSSRRPPLACSTGTAGCIALSAISAGTSAVGCGHVQPRVSLE